MRRTKDASEDAEDGQGAHVVSVCKIDGLMFETLLIRVRVEHGRAESECDDQIEPFRHQNELHALQQLDGPLCTPLRCRLQ